MTGFLNDPNQSNNNPRQFMLAMALMLGVLFTWQTLYPPVPPGAAPNGEGSGEAAIGEAPPAPAFRAEGSAEGSAEGATEAVAAAAPEAEAIPALPPQTLNGASVALAFTNTGARLAEVTVVEPAQYIPKDDVAGIFPEPHERYLPLALRIGGLADLTDDAIFRFDEAASEGSEGDGYDSLVYRWRSPDGAIDVVKRFRATETPFGARMDVEVHNVSASTRRFENLDVRVYGSFSPDEGGGLMGQMGSVVETLCYGEYGTERKPARKVKEGEPRVHEGVTRMAGVNERYFLTAVGAIEGESASPTTSCRAERVDEEHVRTVVRHGGFMVEPGASQRWSYTVFTGPKDERYLDQYAEGFNRSIDFGMFEFLALPIRWLLLFLQGWVGNWGLAIILLTICIKIVLFPITQKGYESMEKMKRVQPKLKKLQEKYENDKMKLAEEQMKLFKDEGVSPAGGCLPMLAQMPIYFALYRTIWGSAELYRAPFFGWLDDLSQSDPYFILPALMGLTMLFQQRLMPQSVDNPQMAMISKVMPVMFTVFMLFLPSGLVLYIFINMLLSIGQMLYIRKKFGDPKPS